VNVAFLGGGNMANALIGGLIARGFEARTISVVEVSPAARERIAAHGVRVSTAPDGASGKADTLVLAVKPQDARAALASVAGSVHGKLVISIAAGLRLAALSRWLGGHRKLVRCMPNTPALVDQAMTAVAAGSHADEAHLETAEALLASVGRVVRVPESQLDAVTALSGSGPAYFFYLVEAMIDAGILLGLPRTLAQDLIVQTAIGSATMLRDSGEHPVQLREAVTSPGGTTIAAIRELEVHGVRAALLAAIEAAARRSRELGAEDS
jgi:pyrroline-5-carboxylate reductase